MTMNEPLVSFFQGLISCHPLADPAEVQIVQDNCGKLTEEARGLVRLSYRSSLTSDASCPTRWDTCRDAPRTKISKKDIYSFCNLPCRRSSIDVSSGAPTAVDKIPQLPPRNPAQRSAQRWLIALEDLEYVSSSDEDDDDDYSTSDSDSETTYTAGDLDFDQCFSDSDSEYDDDDDGDTIMEDQDCPDRTPCLPQTDCRWGGKSINAHEWTFPPNAILPNLQEIFREAALNRDVDINQRIKALAMGGLPQA